MIRIAVLGDIGSGKSFFAKQLNIPLFNADNIVSDLYKSNRNLYAKLKKTFPKHISKFPIGKDDLVKIISQNPTNLKKIIKIVHPLVRKEMNKFLKKNKNKKAVVLDIPLFLENKLNDLTNRITEIKNKTCSICLDNITNPILLDCTHIFCGTCLIQYLNNTNNTIKKCPECRCEIKSTENLTAIVPDKVENEVVENKFDLIGKGVLTKEDTLLEIIKNNQKTIN